ncbi:MAG: tRNA (adenosine(37)-N6)-threonylcarbamoyltransferase complex ATPase subunit type 1 TsaE [Ignavibacteria bacterium RBG_16_34_14]|nr:MAG: tRNA (adenosine(37)-N6)-threonylcarbamoyltransferase complex ATPase subunit type 1 TsaE [Ignavibacteria bacterium RBG_16_34_14]
MNYPFEKAVASPEETKELAGAFANQINSGQPVVLNGELGSGKTFFVKQACNVWGITNVSSPSFAIVNNYNNTKPVYHFDFYRIKNREELFDIGFNDYLNDTEAVIFIEWGNLIPEILPKRRIEINIEILEDTKRFFRFIKYG